MKTTIEKIVIDYVKQQYNIGDFEEFVIQTEDGRIWSTIYWFDEGRLYWSHLKSDNVYTCGNIDDLRSVVEGNDRLIKVNMD